jgi:hypothetical protein
MVKQSKNFFLDRYALEDGQEMLSRNVGNQYQAT